MRERVVPTAETDTLPRVALPPRRRSSWRLLRIIVELYFVFFTVLCGVVVALLIVLVALRLVRWTLAQGQFGGVLTAGAGLATALIIGLVIAAVFWTAGSLLNIRERRLRSIMYIANADAFGLLAARLAAMRRVDALSEEPLD